MSSSHSSAAALAAIQHRGRVPNLVVYKEIEARQAAELQIDEDKPKKLSKTDPLYGYVETVIDLALRVLRHPRGRDGLVLLARAVTDRWAEDGENWYDPQWKTLEEWVELFMERLEKDFPRVNIVRHLATEAEAKAKRWDSIGDKSAYDPKKGGHINLSLVILNDAIEAQSFYLRAEMSDSEREKVHTNLATWLFTLAIGVVRSIAALLVRFLGPLGNAHTPRGLRAAPESAHGGDWSSKPGSAGRALEEVLWDFGGAHLVVYENELDAMRLRQAGVACLVDGEGTITAIERGYLKRFMKGEIELPVQFEPDFPTDITVKTIGSRTMTKMRREVYPFVF